MNNKKTTHELDAYTLANLAQVQGTQTTTQSCKLGFGLKPIHKYNPFQINKSAISSLVKRGNRG